MSPIVHGAVGWLLGQGCARRRERVALAVLAVAPDVDGLGIVVSEQAYVDWHHRLAHGAIAAVVATVVGAVVFATGGDRTASTGRSALVGALLGALAFHSHVVLDLCGSGPGWPILYGWPWTDTEWLPSWQWDLGSWQNGVFGVVVIAACLALGVVKGRTPVEIVSLRADAAVVATLRKRFA